ncbi:hypothetical protein JJC01_19240 [Clostridioides sp. ES-S-0010-02]|nr:hypothetical protein JJC01_10760 [Clostridioides sp. ES-S-0010-02]UDN60221.1 hypothetical protein JJC01_19240 [Clostridioides sp. ES-S-0010-02]UDN63855.1 hypothetical protein IC758_09920 [Clostridioides sp. ES-W-0016-02]
MGLLLENKRIHCTYGSKEMCQSKNITEKESYQQFSKEICKSCKNNKRDCESKDCDTAHKIWLKKEAENYL